MVSADPPVTPDPVRRYLTQLELELRPRRCVWNGAPG